MLEIHGRKWYNLTDMVINFRTKRNPLTVYPTEGIEVQHLYDPGMKKDDVDGVSVCHIGKHKLKISSKYTFKDGDRIIMKHADAEMIRGNNPYISASMAHSYFGAYVVILVPGSFHRNSETGHIELFYDAIDYTVYDVEQTNLYYNKVHVPM